MAVAAPLSPAAPVEEATTRLLSARTAGFTASNAAVPGTPAGGEKKLTPAIATGVESCLADGVDVRGDAIGQLIELVLIARHQRVAHIEQAADLPGRQLRRDVLAVVLDGQQALRRRRRSAERKRLRANHERTAALANRQIDRAVGVLHDVDAARASTASRSPGCADRSSESAFVLLAICPFSCAICVVS